MDSKKWARLTANLEPELAEAAKARAKAQRRSVAGYLTRLIEIDLGKEEPIVADEQAAYITAPKKGEGLGKSNPLSHSGPRGISRRVA